jgi:hypothetical protein
MHRMFFNFFFTFPVLVYHRIFLPVIYSVPVILLLASQRNQHADVLQYHIKELMMVSCSLLDMLLVFLGHVAIIAVQPKSDMLVWTKHW